jgi:tetratricopeptide (TPR) repeat protein
VTARARLAIIGAALLAQPVCADTIVLTNGRVIEADRAWYDGTQLMYEKNGGVYGLPRTLVKSLDQKTAESPSDDPDVIRARKSLDAGDALEAAHVLVATQARHPSSLPVLQTLAEAYLKLGDARKAKQTAEQAVHVADRDARSRALLGDALVALGDRLGAEAEYHKSLQLHPDAAVERKLASLAPSAKPAVAGAQFRIRYDGSVNEPLGVEVLKILSQAHGEYATRLGFSPETPVTVVLQTEAAFQDAGAPEWAEALNDGAIHVPVRGLEQPTPRLVSVLRHELAHSFISERTGGNCPTWLQEGISQWLEGADPTRQDAAAAAAAHQGRLIPLLSLEAPFQALSETDASLAYAESLSAVAHIVRLRGEVGVVRLLSALADRLPSEEALPVALALSYPELEKSWEEHLKQPR